MVMVLIGNLGSSYGVDDNDFGRSYGVDKDFGQ